MIAMVAVSEIERTYVNDSGSFDDPPVDPTTGSVCATDLGRVVSARQAEGAELADLLTRAARADSVAFAELYDRTSARIYGMTLRVLRDPGFAEETTQEVFLQVWRTASSFDSAKGSALSWLMTLAHRRAVDRVRTEQSNTNREIVFETRNQLGEFDQVSEEVLERFEKRAVRECLDTLTAVQRESVALAYYGGHTYREVAEHLDLAVPTVKSRIRDGLIRLRGCLGVA